MKKKKLSLERKKYFRAFAILQVFIILVYIHCMKESIPVDLQDTKTTSIFVEEISYCSHFLSIYSNNVRYRFQNFGISGEYSNSELYETISVGDQMSIVFYEQASIFGTSNWVIGARTGTEVFRSVEEYYKNKNGVPFMISMIFLIIEALFVAVLYFYVIINGINMKRSDRKKT